MHKNLRGSEKPINTECQISREYDISKCILTYFPEVSVSVPSMRSPRKTSLCLPLFIPGWISPNKHHLKTSHLGYIF